MSKNRERAGVDLDYLNRLNSIYQVTPLPRHDQSNSFTTADFPNQALDGILNTLELIERLKLAKIHGQLLVDEYGLGVLIMGEAGIGKSKLTAELLQQFPGYKFIADDFPLISVKDGVFYGGHHPLKPNSHTAISFNPDLHNKNAPKIKLSVPPKRRVNFFVKIHRVFHLWANPHESKKITLHEGSIQELNNLIRNSIALLQEPTQGLVGENGLTFTEVGIPTDKTGQFDRLATYFKTN